MRRRRTIYFNDARHFYLFVFEPPMRLEDAWRPVDEAAGTAVDTFIYGVERGDGLFYPSKVGKQFGAGEAPHQGAYRWRASENMRSLTDRGLDPLTVLIDRAHEKGMDFFTSLRLGGYGDMAPEHGLENGGRGFVHPEVRERQLAMVDEMAAGYATEGVELDFAAAPGGSAFCLRPEDVAEYTPVMTQFVHKVADIVRGRPGKPGEVGARIYPTEELNLKAGLDVRTWLRDGLVDYVVPMLYLSFVLDADMPIDWLVEAAHESDVSIYGMLQPYYRDESRRFCSTENATPAMMRAAAANSWALGVDGLYTWFLPWPVDDAGRRTLTELGDPELVREADKHYFLRRRSESAKDHDYPAHLPLEIPAPDPHERHRIPFAIADDPGNDRVRRVLLRVDVSNLVSADRLEILLNGESLDAEPCERGAAEKHGPYAAQWLKFRLEKVRPKMGRNLLEVSLLGRPDGLAGGVTVEDVEIIVEYGMFPAKQGM